MLSVHINRIGIILTAAAVLLSAGEPARAFETCRGDGRQENRQRQDQRPEGEGAGPEKGDRQVKLLMAERLLRDGRTGEAINILEPLYRENDGTDMLWQLLVAAYVRSGNPEKSLRLLQSRIERYDADYEHLKALGGVYMEMGDPESAEKAWMRILEGGKEKAGYYHDVANLLWGAGRYDRAIAVLRKGAEYPRFFSAYMKKIVKWERLMNRSRSAFRDELERVLRETDRNIRNARRLTEVFMEAGSDTALISAVDSLALVYQDSTCVPKLLKCSLFAIAGDFERAERIIGSADCAEQTQYISFISLLGLVETGETGTGLISFQNAVIDNFLSKYGETRLAPRLLLEKAGLLFRQAEIEDDPDMLNRAFSLASRVPEHRFGAPYRDKAHLLMAGIELDGRGRPRRAVEILNGPAWRQKGMRKEGLVLRARAYSMCLDCEGAEEELEKLSGNRDPEVSSEALYRLSEMLLHKGEYEKAAERFAEAAKKVPGRKSSNDALELAMVIKKGLSGDTRALDLISAASFLESSGKLARAADSLDLLARDCPDSPLLPYTIFWSSSLKIASGREREAEEMLAELSEDYPNSIYAPRALESLADIRAADEPAEALEMFRTIIDRYPSDPYIDRVRRKCERLGKKIGPEGGQKGEEL